MTFRIWFVAVLLLLPLASGAAGESRRPVPEPLRGWVDWVREPAPCPRISGMEHAPICAWPHQLLLEKAAGEARLRFRQQWDVDRPGWIPLPGDSQSWPVNVRIDKSPAIVVSRRGKPFVFADRGRVGIRGELAGQQGLRPFAIPPDTALVRFVREGVERPVYLDDKAMLRFEPAGYAGEVKPRQDKDSLTLKVFRRFTDNVPTDIVSVLRLTVSGKPREVDFGKVTLPRAVPLAVKGPLKARINENGELSAIVRPGVWEITVSSWLPADLKAWKRGQPGSPFWPAHEYWFFERVPALYATELGGSPAIDPKSIDAPRGWGSLAAYRVAPDGGLRVKRLSRGTLVTGETRARIERDAWIGFSGRKLFVRDRVRGEARPYASLVAAHDSVEPRAVYLDGRPQVLVRTPEGVGVSLRNRRLDADVLGVAAPKGSLAMPGNYFSDLKAESLTARLHLPPGWRLLAIESGVKGTTWLSRWSLYQVFLLIMISIAFARVNGWGWGAFALATLGVTFHEPETPVLLWLALLGLVAALRDGLGNTPRLKMVLQKARLVVLLAIGVWLLGYTVTHVRDAIHPQLNWSVGADDAPGVGVERDVVMEEAPRAPPMALKKRMAQAVEKAAPSGALLSIPETYPASSAAPPPRMDGTEGFRRENEIRSTVGIPRWRGRVYSLRWDASALQRAEPFDMLLMTPAMNRLFGFVSSLMLILLFLAAMGVDPRKGIKRLRRGLAAKRAAATLLLVTPMLGWPPAPAQAGDYPPEYLLKQLAREVNRPPDCLPDCVSLDRLHASLSREGALRLRFRIHALDAVAAPLLETPRGGVNFTAFVVNDNGLRGLPLERSGQRLMVRLERGAHEVMLQGVVSGKTLQLGLPLTVRQYTETLEGWRGSHVHRPGSWQSLSFRKQSAATPAEQGPKGLSRSQIPPFFAVTRELALSDGMFVDTTVRRLSPPGSVETVAIPAWPKEVILKAGDQVSRKGEAIQVVFNAGDSTLKFRSSLQFSEDELAGYRGGVLRKIILPPAPAAQRTQWRFDYSSQWNVEVAGLPIIYEQTRSGENLKSLRPWPGETATILISRVEPIPGATVAIQRLTLSLAPHAAGPGASGGALELSAEIETTQAQTLMLETPEATIHSVRVNGRRINNEAAGKARIPLDMGKARVVVSGELKQGITGVYREPEILFKGREGKPVAIYNALTEVTLPENRWVYRADGRGVGPDFLFWSILPPLLLLALALHFMKLGQLNGLGWLLVMVGFTQANSFGLYIGIGMSLLFIGWLYLLKIRAAIDPFKMTALQFNALQILLLVTTLAALISMGDGLFNGLLGHPKMQVAGNGSNAWFLRWFSDQGMPRASILSLPLLYYRIAILLWAVWLSFIVLRWIKYGWSAFSKGTLFRAAGKRTGETVAAAKDGAVAKSGKGVYWFVVLAGLILIYLVANWYTSSG
ncbi:MAG TPA: hypothetical protein ENK26_06520 [Gammaproteobacteria bacterium]|nr:hypothetical protein [Gammaproteobacteria bacterium]